MQRRPPTIMDVARRAGVSIGTVSNVLSGATPVSEDKRARVLAAIGELGYAQNRLAQGLRRRHAPLVGLCVPFTSISYFAALVDAFEEVASDRGFEIMQVLSRQDPGKELQRVKALLRYQVGGVMLLPSIEPGEALAAIRASNTPLVIIDRPLADPTLDQVTFDNYGAMVEATTRLLALGHRRLLFICRQRRLSITVQRIEALRAAAARAGEPVELRVLECSYEESSFATRIRHELDPERRPTAIIVSNSTLAAWTFRAFRALGVRCPDEVSLLAFDEPDWADLVEPTLSVIRQPTRAIAFTAWEFLIRRMRGEADTAQRVELKAELVFRRSIGPAAATARAATPAGAERLAPA